MWQYILLLCDGYLDVIPVVVEVSMIEYLVFLIGGATIGLLLANRYFDKTKKYLLPSSILFLLFFMGVGIGKDPHLSSKIADFGINAVVISISSIFFSIVFVYLFVRVLRRFL